MASSYVTHHYVPEWYQKRFFKPGDGGERLYYLRLKPEYVYDARGVRHQLPVLKHFGTKQCFYQDDLYTLRFGSDKLKEIETLFFGQIDDNGSKAVNYFANFSHLSVNGEMLKQMMLYMSTQKLRTPKGLEWLSTKLSTSDWNKVLVTMTQIKELYSAIWTECVWQIADATQSQTKFIISDHPVTVYNRVCGPRNKQYCREINDPDISLNATHTVFPLTYDKVLILTNLSWVRDPYQSEITSRPNPNPFRSALFNFMDIQVLRHLSETEVRQINFIIKSRAYRYIAAYEESWLYPEQYVSKSDWSEFGQGYLLMPDPRAVDAGGEVYWGSSSGEIGGAMDSYGRMPWQRDFGAENKSDHEFKALHRFKGEFARLFGPPRRGRSFKMAVLDREIDTDVVHKMHLDWESVYTR